ncbi:MULTISPECIES: SusD/RagB family nutrient-binding outer membrane lipoprotein [Flavobacteriaceae]|uniref:SusD/RagB family nutrient-binding outer membrane lipoprotein n=1 Tax=Flavobacteriaceae TaxID=49546 RepID=UPI001490ACF3|nr:MULTISPECIES: SusD/RagB family nutrient-binding outer membrane lipoprotein [Allomuricauda]MDC6366778.1 SusD/RagB family nutrient-binding outer membrane lipoprotein [Muricauda sp. AC10]
MYSYIKRLLLVGLALMYVSCDSDFAELNTDPNKAGADIFDPNLILPTIIYDYSDYNTGYSGAILFQSMWVQIMASTSTGGANYYSNADKYVASGSTTSYQQSLWNGLYSAASQARQMEKLAIEQELPNLAAIGKMLQIMNIAMISDVYGDVPYEEALLGDEGVNFPTYQSQESLYPQMLADLETAVTALSNSGDSPTNDTMYGGDISQWRKFGYSLMLKLAMRLTKVDASTAQTYVNTAISGGIFESSADDAVAIMDNSNGYANTNANSLNVTDDIYEVRWSKTLIDFLKSTDDPRVSVIAEIPPAGLEANKDGIVVGDSDPSIQIGLPNGYDLKGSSTDISNHPDYPGPTLAANSDDSDAPIGNYSRPTAIYRDRDASWFILTYAETQFLLAEAAVRGFTSGNASDHYNAGVVAAMETLNKMGGTQIEGGDATTYASANPLDTSSADASLEMINEQLWASVGILGNFVEAWNNWRRSDYPVLTPVNYTGNFSGGNIPSRQPYPTSEGTNNTDNYQAAVSAMGGSDDWVTKAWWDVE